jgi:hypothetical protein
LAGDLVGGMRNAAAAASILDRWTAEGYSGRTTSRIGFTQTGDPTGPIWLPAAGEVKYRNQEERRPYSQ